MMKKQIFMYFLVELFWQKQSSRKLSGYFEKH